MASESELWEFDEPINNLVDVPPWISATITGYDVAAIRHGGCASGAYMPAVTYYDARQTMAEHGDEVLQFIEDYYGELPAPRRDESWSGIAVHYLSIAVELWAEMVADEVTKRAKRRKPNTRERRHI